VINMAKIKWTADFCSNSGYGEAARQYCLALHQLGQDLICDDFHGMYPIGYTWMAETVGKDPRGYLQITHALPSMVSEAYYTVFEFDRAPEEWRRILEKAKLVFTASEYSAYSLASVCDIAKIHVIHHGVNQKFNKTVEPMEFNEELPSFKFLSVFEWIERKCGDRLLKAFTQEFGKEEDVCLILKTRHPTRPTAMQIRKWVNDENVYWFDGFIPELAPLYRACNAYVSCSAGEGWGETLSEAMACGLPTIGSRCGGNLEFMNDDNSFLVECEDWQMVGENVLFNIIKPWFQYQPPKIDEMRKAMRLVYEGGDEVKHRAKNATRITKDFSWEKAAKELITIVEAYQV